MDSFKEAIYQKIIHHFKLALPGGHVTFSDRDYNNTHEKIYLISYMISIRKENEKLIVRQNRKRLRFRVSGDYTPSLVWFGGWQNM